jgi:hypothetical protein
VDGEVVGLEPEELLRLHVGDAWCKIGQSAFPMRTEKFDAVAAPGRLRQVIERSRARWGVALERAREGDAVAGRPPDGGPSLDDLDAAEVF